MKNVIKIIFLICLMSFPIVAMEGDNKTFLPLSLTLSSGSQPLNCSCLFCADDLSPHFSEKLSVLKNTSSRKTGKRKRKSEQQLKENKNKKQKRTSKNSAQLYRKRIADLRVKLKETLGIEKHITISNTLKAAVEQIKGLKEENASLRQRSELIGEKFPGDRC